MNDQKSWDSVLVKKYSSSNHYKLLNQLRNEVKKYPLNNKKNTISIKNKDTNQDNKNKSKVSHAHDSLVPNHINSTKDSISNQSNVSFNNSKNFSIYNQTSNKNINTQNASFLPDQYKSNEDASSPTFAERLNQIEMK